MLALVFGLGSSLCWGVSDFMGGSQSRRLPLLAVMLCSQAAGLVFLPLLVVLSGDPAPTLSQMLPAIGAGAAGTIALTAFYRGLAIGTMSIVAPISATGAAVPVIVGIAGGDRPAALRLAGMAAAIVGVMLASREVHADAVRAADARRSVGLALIAALGFGTFFVGMGASSHTSVPWALLATRTTSTGLLALAALVVRPRLGGAARSLPTLALIGLLDVGANGLYGLATTAGLLSVVGVLGSLYPVVTILLARGLLGERVRRVQEVGIVAALAGVAMIAAG